MVFRIGVPEIGRNERFREPSFTLAWYFFLEAKRWPFASEGENAFSTMRSSMIISKELCFSEEVSSFPRRYDSQRGNSFPPWELMMNFSVWTGHLIWSSFRWSGASFLLIFRSPQLRSITASSMWTLLAWGSSPPQTLSRFSSTRRLKYLLFAPAMKEIVTRSCGAASPRGSESPGRPRGSCSPPRCSHSWIGTLIIAIKCLAKSYMPRASI